MRKILLEYLAQPINIPINLIRSKSLYSNCATKIFSPKPHDETLSEDDTALNHQSYKLIGNTALGKS